MTERLLDAWMPRADLSTRQAIILDASAARVYTAARAHSLMDTPLARLLLRVRALPALFDPRGSPETAHSLIVLAEDAPREILFGLAGPFWHPSRNIVPLANAEAWRAFARDGMAKAAVSIAVASAADGRAELSTETRVLCYGDAARRSFRLYWLWAGVGSGLIRRVWLRAVRGGLENKNL
ncbi:MAG: hypothetical protein HZB53_03315 [Chloroflexi bacterium]|nr:hypothetical protein [Chloroflexota bacterium]